MVAMPTQNAMQRRVQVCTQQSSAANKSVTVCLLCCFLQDIPPGITAVLTKSSTDVLSHVAIRARSQGVLLATCFEDAEWQRLVAMQVGVGATCLWITWGVGAFYPIRQQQQQEHKLCFKDAEWQSLVAMQVRAGAV
jgi:hypothetical protein